MKNILLPLYLQQKIIKFCFFDEVNSFKWKLSLCLLSKKHFEYVSKCFTKINSLILTIDPNIVIDKLKNPYCPLKYPILLNKSFSIDSLYSYVRHYYFPKLLSILGDGNLNSINLTMDGSTSSIPISSVLPKLIESNKDLQSIKLNSKISNNLTLDFQNNLYKPLLETNNNSIKNISLNMVDLDVFQFSKFLNDYQNKTNVYYSGNDGIEKLKLHSYQGFGNQIKLDQIQINLFSNIKSLNFSNTIIETPSIFFQKLSFLKNLKSLVIPFLTIINNNTSLTISDSEFIQDYQIVFNKSLLNYLKVNPLKLEKLETPFPLDFEILKEISSNDQMITNLTFTPKNEMVSFNSYLKKLVLKLGYSNQSFQDFCKLNKQQSTINFIEINNCSNELVPFFCDFIKNNKNLSTVNFNQSLNYQDYQKILESMNFNGSVENVSLIISENSPQLDNTNTIFNFIDNCSSISNLKLTLYFYFQGFKLSLIDSKKFNLISIEDYKLLFFKN
ncbi:hypothetical protein RB653_003244 [Dictyostelium firmibasis]|uniref:Uncharacterized protein n=1 Tax=Dictyostelium firmibasis TaxID=79012 RepID=A0AAN7TZB7_9MYCE